jgi:hypothetical protein
MSSSHRPPSAARIGAVDDGAIHKTALFLVRVFGAAASAVAAERCRKSDQAADWCRVAAVVDRLLDEAPPGDLDASPQPPQA